MKILFIHQNFPGQFIHLAPELAKLGHQVRAIKLGEPGVTNWQGVDVYGYRPNRETSLNIHPWVADFETKVIRADGVLNLAKKLSESGYCPDIVFAHPGWGEAIFIKDVWPDTKLITYCEFFYKTSGADINFDSEFPENILATACKIRIKNINSLAYMSIADYGYAPTAWQMESFPQYFRDKISVIHDGIDTNTVRPESAISLDLMTFSGSKITLSKSDQLVTFVNRNLEPYRGYHIFMRSLPELLRRNPNLRVLIIGGDEVSYGPGPSDAKSWKKKYIDEIKPQLSSSEWARVHFLGKVPYSIYLSILQISTVHVYLTYPFVLSWSLLEAMSAGCAIVASDTAPVREVINDGETGCLVNFFDVEGIVQQVNDLLAAPDKRSLMGAAARQYVINNYDLKTVVLPRQISFIQSCL